MKIFLPLKTFLQRKAKAYHDRQPRSEPQFLGTKIVGYISLVCGEIDLDEENRIHESDESEKMITIPQLSLRLYAFPYRGTISAKNCRSHIRVPVYASA